MGCDNIIVLGYGFILKNEKKLSEEKIAKYIMKKFDIKYDEDTYDGLSNLLTEIFKDDVNVFFDCYEDPVKTFFVSVNYKIIANMSNEKFIKSKEEINVDVKLNNKQNKLLKKVYTFFEKDFLITKPNSYLYSFSS